jgi:hypothetical protein
MAAFAPTVVVCVPVAVISEVSPRLPESAETMESMEMLSPALAPTWKVALAKEPSSSLVPLKLVVLATRSIYRRSWVT